MESMAIASTGDAYSAILLQKVRGLGGYRSRSSWRGPRRVGSQLAFHIEPSGTVRSAAIPPQKQSVSSKVSLHRKQLTQLSKYWTIYLTLGYSMNLTATSLLVHGVHEGLLKHPLSAFEMPSLTVPPKTCSTCQQVTLQAR